MQWVQVISEAAATATLVEILRNYWDPNVYTEYICSDLQKCGLGADRCPRTPAFTFRQFFILLFLIVALILICASRFYSEDLESLHSIKYGLMQPVPNGILLSYGTKKLDALK